jgi:nucleoside permease NupC
MLHVISTLVVAIVAVGLLSRHRPSVHLRLMATAFAIDLGLVLYIEVSRHAVERVAGQGAPLLWFHAAVSTLVLGLYVGQIALGRRILAGRRVPRRAHFALGMAFCVLRSLNYATAFMVSTGHPSPVASQAVVEVRVAPAAAAISHESD